MKCVIKLGGSLIKNAQIHTCLSIIQKWPSPTIIVPGGGVFADSVRNCQAEWQFDDSIAHRMAILAMQQSALLIHSLSPDFALLDSVSKLELISTNCIWSPQCRDLDQGGIPHSWDISSDSLAAWIARRWQADLLILVKSAVFDRSASITELQAQGILDAAFHQYVEQGNLQIKIIPHADLADLHDQIA